VSIHGASSTWSVVSTHGGVRKAMPNIRRLSEANKCSVRQGREVSAEQEGGVGSVDKKFGRG
jgi:hypothetical protein